MTRLLRSLMTGVIAIVIITCGTLWLLLGTVRGGQWLVAQAAGFIPGELLIEAQGGSILSGLMADRVVYRHAEFDVEFTAIRLNIRLIDVLRKRITIESLTAVAVSVDEIHLTDIGLSGFIELRDDFPLAGKLRWYGADGQISGSGKFSGDLAQLEFTQHVALPAAVDVSGVVHPLLAQPSIDATVTFIELPMMIDAGQSVISNGRFILSGTAERLIIERAEAMVFGGRVSASGAINFTELTATLKIFGEDLDPSTVYPDFDGRLGFALRIDAHSIADIDIELDRLSGEFLGTPVDGMGSLRLRAGLVERVTLEIQSGQNWLDLSAGAKPEFAGEFRLDIPELLKLWPGVEGSLTGAGQFGGTWEQPIVSVRLDGAQFQLGELNMEQIHIDGRVAASGDLDWTLQAQDASNGELNLGNLHLRVHGKLEDHQLEVHVSDGAIGAQLSAHGVWDGVDRQLQTTIKSAVISSDTVGEWTLREAVAARWSVDDWSIDAHCWVNSAARICSQGASWRDGRWIAAATLRRFPLATFEPWLGEDIKVRGEADADLTVDWKEGSSRVIDASWRQGETRISFSAEDTMAQPDDLSMTISAAQFALTADESIATVEGQVTGEFGLTMRVSGSLDDPLSEGGKLAGRVDAQIPDIGELRPLINRFLLTSAVGGAIKVSAEISGTIAAPVINGRAYLSDGSAGLAISGIELTEANLAITGQAGNVLRVEGSVRSGEGLVRVDGEVDVFGVSNDVAQLHLAGNNFEVLRLPDQRVVISPDVELSLVDGNFMIAGRVLVPEAEFVLQELGQSAITISEDVIVHEEQLARQPRLLGPRLIGSFDLLLGDNVRFSGFGVDTRLTGGLKLTESIDNPLAAEGSLQLVDGSYEMFGKVLTIEQGSLNFYGPLDDPVLDVRATRRVRYQNQIIRAGVIVTGRITRQLDFVLFSDPLYSDADILSYLLVDRPASTADGVDGSALSGAAVAMGLQSLTGGIGEGLSLDEVGLEGAGGDDTAVVAGKRFSEDVYIRYSYGLFSRIGTLLIRYELGHGFSIEAGSGEQQTLDLLYSIDR